MPKNLLGDLFEQYIGLELCRFCHFTSGLCKVRYWKDFSGPEVDYVLDRAGKFLPIEVKWKESPNAKDARHIEKFMEEYPDSGDGVIVCRTPRPYKISQRVTALPWQQIPTLFSG